MSQIMYKSDEDGSNPWTRLHAHDHSYSKITDSFPEEQTVFPCTSQTLGLGPSHAACNASASTSAPSPTAPSSATAVGSLEQGLQYAKEYLERRVKPSTKTQYDRVYKIWKDFCAENGLSELGAGHEALAACLSLVMKSSGSFSKVTMLSAAIANEHRLNMRDSPTDHRCIGDLMKGFRASAEVTRQPVLPITEVILHQMIEKVYHPSHGRDGQKATTVLWRTVWRVAMEFHTLGRYSDIVKLKREGNSIVTYCTL